MSRFAWAIVLVLICSPVWGQSGFEFRDDFESGMDNWMTAPPALSGYYSSMAMDWSSDMNAEPAGSGHSLYQNNLWDKVYHNLGVELSGRFEATWYIYDNGTDTGWFGEVRAYQGTGCETFLNLGFENVFAAGLFYSSSGTGASYYQGRATKGDTTGWFSLDAPTAPQRSQGWHRFDIKRLDSGTMEWYVDGMLSKTVTGCGGTSIDSVLLGRGTWDKTSSGLPPYGIPTSAYYDGVSVVGVVPEPSSILALLGGLVSLPGIRRRRK